MYTCLSSITTTSFIKNHLSAGRSLNKKTTKFEFLAFYSKFILFTKQNRIQPFWPVKRDCKKNVWMNCWILLKLLCFLSLIEKSQCTWYMSTHTYCMWLGYVLLIQEEGNTFKILFEKQITAHIRMLNSWLDDDGAFVQSGSWWVEYTWYSRTVLKVRWKTSFDFYHDFPI